MEIDISMWAKKHYDRRLILIGPSILLFLLILEAYYIYGDKTPKYELFGDQGAPAQEIKTSRLHYLMPSTSSNTGFCAMVTSALVNRYPVPYILGWKGQGKYNATKAHVAKLHSLQRYLHILPHGGDDDDLVIFNDGHDVMAQLPPEVVIERYFQVAAEADARLADRFGISISEAHKLGLRHTLFWGADKLCYPLLYSQPQCKDVPFSHLAPNRFGPKSGNGEFTYNDNRWLNSGSVIGRLDDLRSFIDAGVAELNATYDPESKYKDSDQMYLARLFARQEVARTALIQDRALPKANEEISSIHQGESTGGKDPSAAGLEGNTTVRKTEFHMALDYESSIIQTGCFNWNWLHKLNYNNPDNTATMSEDSLSQGKYFRPYPIQMPANVYQSFVRTFNLLPKQHSFNSARDWIGSLNIQTNIVSKHIFGFYHATCNKKNLLDDFKSYWFHPYIEPLLNISFHAIQAGEPITEKLIDGRRWEHKISYADAGVTWNSLGGIFTDYENQAYISFEALCSDHADIFSFNIHQMSDTNRSIG